MLQPTLTVDEEDIGTAEADDVRVDLAFDPYRWSSAIAPPRPTPPSLDDLIGVPLS